MMYIAYKKINGYTISDNTDHQRFLYRRGVSAPTILVLIMSRRFKLHTVARVPYRDHGIRARQGTRIMRAPAGLLWLKRREAIIRRGRYEESSFTGIPCRHPAPRTPGATCLCLLAACLCIYTAASLPPSTSLISHQDLAA